MSKPIPEVIIDHERKFNDPIFTGDQLSLNDKITNDNKYNNPQSVTWLQTSQEDSNFWGLIDGIPVPFEFNANVNRLSNYRGLVQVIKVVYFNKTTFKFMANDFIQYIESHNLVLTASEKTALIEYMDNYVHGSTQYGGKLNIRFISSMLLNEFKEREVAELGGIKIGTSISKLRTDIGTDVDTGSIKNMIENDEHCEVTFTYRSPDNEQIKFNLGGFEVRLNPDVSNNARCGSLGVAIKQGEQVRYTSIVEREFDEHSILKGEPSDSDGYSDTTDIDKHKLEVFKILADEKKSMYKFSTELQVSIHKLYSYVIRNESAVLTLEKEELSLLKETMKSLKDIIPK